MIPVTTIVDRMRLVKEPGKIALAKRYRSEGAVHAFDPIVAGGPNACTLCYRNNDERLARDKLLLVDSGCEIGGYCSDITRTYPVSGRFAEPQRELYSVVLEARKKTIVSVRPGIPCDLPERVATESLAKGLIRPGLVKGPLRAAIAKGAHRRFYPHRIGHWLGMDVYDIGPYLERPGRPVRLAPGMVLTIEPGLYIGNGKGVPARYRGIGSASRTTSPW